jgi:putative hydrolase of the HAD superfamily
LYRAVLFDFFGTLTEAVVRGPWHASIARRLGCDPVAFIEVLDRSFPARCRGIFGTAEATLRWVCDQLGADPPADRLRAVVRDRIAAVWADTRLRPDAVAVLAALDRRRFRTAVVSDCGYELPAFLPRLPVAPLLDTCVYSVDIGECKPEPAIYLAACERLAVSPEECLYVGDGGSRELTGAAAVGMQPVRLAAPDLHRHLVFAPDRDFTGPVVDSLTAAVRLLDRPARTPVRPVAARSARLRPVPAGSVPAGSVPAGSAPAGSVPAGSAPAGSVPAGVTSPP